jgi:hypothetical protein
MLSEESIHSLDVRAAVLDFIMGSGAETVYDSMREPLHQYLSVVDGDTSDVLISIAPKIVACGKGNFLVHASISIPGYSLLQHDNDDDSLSDDDEARFQRLQHIVPPTSAFRLFIISTQRGGQIVHSRDTASCLGLYSSRPFLRRMGETPAVLCTNVAIQNPTKIVLLELSLKRDGTFDVKEDWIQLGIMRDKCPMALSQTQMIYGMGGPGRLQIKVHAISSDHFSQKILADFDSRGSKLHNVIVLNENYVIAIVGFTSSTAADEDEDEAFDAHWFGSDDVTTRTFVYHIPSFRLVHDCAMPSLPISFDVFKGTLAFNAATLGFVIAGATTREVARNIDDVDRMPDNDLSSPSGKLKGKKKRLASKTAKKDKKDGFARGMSLRG